MLKEPGKYVVSSQSGQGHYIVTLGAKPGELETCTCPDFLGRNEYIHRSPCKHIHLVRLDRESEQSAAAIGAPPKIERRRDWARYNEAQMAEGRLFRQLLRDLADEFPEPYKEPTRAGRKPVPLGDQAFCAVQRSYYGLSLRRSHDLRQIAVEKNFLPSAHSFSLVSHFLCREDVTEGLHQMLVRAAWPLAPMERSAAIDSTGLRTTGFNYYRHEKYDSERENVWLKLHAIAGVRTHVIPVLEVTSGSSNDSPQFPVLLNRAHEFGFDFQEICADRAYQGRENFNVAERLSVIPFIPFKRNQTGQAKGSPLYRKMYLFWLIHAEEADKHYGQRQQAESTFGSIKQKLTETLVSRKFTSQVNEVLCMAIAHNIMVLIRTMFETNLFPDGLRPSTADPDLARQPGGGLSQLFLNRPAPRMAVRELGVVN